MGFCLNMVTVFALSGDLKISLSMASSGSSVMRLLALHATSLDS